MGVSASFPAIEEEPLLREQLLGALKRGDGYKAKRLVGVSAKCATDVSSQARAQLIHSAVKKGNMSILAFLNALPPIELVSDSGAASLHTSESPASGAGGAGPAPATETRPSQGNAQVESVQQSADGLSSRTAPVASSTAAEPDSAAAGSGPNASSNVSGSTSGSASPSPPASASPSGRIAPTAPGSPTAGPRSALPRNPSRAALSTSTSNPPASASRPPTSASLPRRSSSADLPPSTPPSPADLTRAWIDATDRRGRTPLATAVRRNRPELVSGLVALGACPWTGDRRCRSTPLHWAAWLGHEPLVAAILESRVPPPRGGSDSAAGRKLCDVRDMYGLTPLHYAAAAGHADVAAVLLAAGASWVAPSDAPCPDHPLLHRPRAPHGSGSGPGGPLSRRSAAAAAALAAVQSRLAAVGAAPSGWGGGGVLRLPPLAARSGPLHIAALLGDGPMVTVILRRYLSETEDMTRQARERVPDPRRQLNKDGFQPYMLAGNAGHWAVAQLLIPFSRDNQLLTRDREFLLFFPLPNVSPAATAAAAAAAAAAAGFDPAAAASVHGTGPPPLRELAGRVWASKLLADLKVAEAALRSAQRAAVTAACGSTAGGGGGAGAGGGGPLGRSSGGGVLGALLGRSLRAPWGPAAVPAAAPAAAAGGGCTAAGAGGDGSMVLSGASSPLGGSSPRVSLSGGPHAPPHPRRGASSAGLPAAAAAAAAVAPQPGLATPPRTSAAGPAAAAAGPAAAAAAASPAAAVLSSRRSASLEVQCRSPAPRTPSNGSLAGAAAGGLPYCDVCFEAPQELLLRPCPHRLCAVCCRRVVEMHTLARRPVPPRCPFCQVAIRGFVPAPAPQPSQVQLQVQAQAPASP